MKTVCSKISSVLKTIFGYSIMLCLLLGGLTFLGYLVALIIGGDIASEICIFIYKKIFPYIITVSNISVLLGLIAMYLNGEVVFTSRKKNKK